MNGNSNNNGAGQKYSRGESFSAAALMNKNADHVFDAPGGIAFRLNPDGYGKASSAERDRVASFVNEWINREKDPASDIPGAPPLFGQDVAPHAMTFASKIGSQARTYLPSDESLEANPNDALLMRKDLGIMECLEIRQRMSALLDWSIVPEDTKSPAQKSIAAEITKIVNRIKRFTEYRRCLMDAIWIGRSAIQHTYGHGNIGGKMYCYPRAKHADATGWKHIHGDKVVFRYDDGEKLPAGAFPDQMGIRVSSVIQKDSRIRKIQDLEYTNSGAAIFLSPAERQTIICHKHMIEDAEYQNPRKAGRIHGVGIRDRIYNEWFLKQEILGFLMEYMERSAGGIEIYEYPSGDAEAKHSVMEAAKNRMAFGRNQIFFPKPLGMDSAVYDLRIVEPGFAGIDMLLNIMDKYFGHRIKRYIIGQTLSTEADATGLGSSVADFQKDSLAQIVMYDSSNLQETLTHELVRPIQLANWPETESWQFEMKHELESDNVKEKLDGYRTAWEMGLGIPEKDVAEAIGVSLDNPNEKILRKSDQDRAAAGMGGNGMNFPAGTGFGNQIDAAHDHVKAAGEVRGLKDGVIDHVAGKLGTGDGGGNPEVPSSPAVNQDQYARQMSLWDEEEHPRDGEGKFVEKGDSLASSSPAETLPEPKKNTGPAGLTKSEAIQKAKKGGTGLLKHAEAVSATMIYLGTNSGQWSAVPVEDMVEVQDSKGSGRMVPQFAMPKDYTPVETPWSGSGAGGEFCCELCATPIKNAFHIQNDEKKWLMMVGSECVTKFGDGMSGEQLAKKDMQKKRRSLVKTSHEAIKGFAEKIKEEKGGRNVTLQDVARAIGNEDSRKRFWKVAKSLGIDPYSTQWKIEKDGVVHDDDFKHLDGFVTREKSTDQKINNWHKKNSEDAEMMLKDLKRFGVDVEKYAREFIESDHPRDIAGKFTSSSSPAESSESSDNDESSINSLPDYKNARPQLVSEVNTPMGKISIVAGDYKKELELAPGEFEAETFAQVWRGHKMLQEFTSSDSDEAIENAQDLYNETVENANLRGEVVDSGDESNGISWNVHHDGNGMMEIYLFGPDGDVIYQEGGFDPDEAVEMAKEIAKETAGEIEGQDDPDSEDPEKYQRRSHRLLNEAASMTDTNPSEAQREAGNYAKGVYSWKGLEIAIENPKGSTRSGCSSSGREWSRTMASHYGYFRRTKANDGDALDVFIGNHPDSDFVLVIKQVDQNGEFDEFKVVVGCLNRKEAKKLYLANYPKGWKCGPAASMTVDLFKKWVESGGPMRAKSLAKSEC